MANANKVKLPDGTYVSLNDERFHIYRTLTGTAADTVSPYSHTKWDVTDSTITEYVDGMVVCLKVPVAGNGTYGTGLQINDLGYKPVVFNVNSMISTRYSVGSVIWCVYNATQTASLYINSTAAVTVTGCWQVQDYDTNTNTIGYQLRTNSSTRPVSSATYRYRLMFSSLDNSKWVPATNSTSTNATSSRTVNQEVINPWGRIVYYSTTTSRTAGQSLSATAQWDRYVFNLGYSFNDGSALDLTFPGPVYIKCTPQAGGGAIIDSTTPYTQSLPSTADGKIYIYLGQAYSASEVELIDYHPVLYHDGSKIAMWTGAVAESDLFDCVMTKENNVWSCDHTWAEIYAAHQAGKLVRLTQSSGSIYMPMSIDSNSGAFSAALSGALVSLKFDVISTFYYDGNHTDYSDDWTLFNEAHPMFSFDYQTKLNGIEAGAQVNVQSDWNQSDSTADDYIKNKPKIYVETTWAALKNLRDNSTLVPGTLYRITDYVTTTSETDTRSVGNQFDIIVQAMSNSVLSKECKAILHDGDTYFSGAGADLSKWKIWYDLDNDNDKYSWAVNPTPEKYYIGTNSFSATDFATFPFTSYGVDERGYYCYWITQTAYMYVKSAVPAVGDTLYQTTDGGTTESEIGTITEVEHIPATSDEGKGVIFRMIDEYGNDFPYDFKNIQTLNPYTNNYNYTFGSYSSGDFDVDHTLNGAATCNKCEPYYVAAAGFSPDRKINLNHISIMHGSDSWGETTAKNITFEQNCRYIFTKQYEYMVKNLHFVEECHHIYISKDDGYAYTFQNILIKTGGDSSNYLTLGVTGNNSYYTIIAKDTSGTLRVYCNEDQVDWNESDTSSKRFIKNKPTIPEVNFTHTANATVSTSTTTVTFAANTRGSAMLTISADLGLTIACNNGSDNYIWVKNTGSSEVDITISGVTKNSTNVSNVYVPSDGISVPAGGLCEIGIIVNTDGAFLTSRNDLSL